MRAILRSRCGRERETVVGVPPPLTVRVPTGPKYQWIRTDEWPYLAYVATFDTRDYGLDMARYDSADAAGTVVYIEKADD